jgi:hypothetical protein
LRQKKAQGWGTECQYLWAESITRFQRRGVPLKGHGSSRADQATNAVRALQAAEKGQMLNEKPEKRPSGAKAHVDLIALAARLKSCPVTKQEFFRSP